MPLLSGMYTTWWLRGCGRESRRRRLFFTSVGGYHPSACDLKGLEFVHRARVAELDGRTPEDRREREGGGTGGVPGIPKGSGSVRNST